MTPLWRRVAFRLTTLASSNRNSSTRDPRLAEYLRDYPSSLFSEELYQSIELMERYSIALAVRILGELGVIEALQRAPASRTQLCASLGLSSQFAPALQWLLRRIVETGSITRAGETFRFQHPAPEYDLNALKEEGLALSAGNAPTFALLDFAAKLYPPGARDGQGAEQVLFSPEGIGLWLDYFSNSNLTYSVNNWLAAELATDLLRERAAIRILEVGAGAGSASELLLRYLEERGLTDKVERYLITEPNAFFRRRGQRMLTQKSAQGKIEWAGFDLNQPWKDQLEAEFDLIYGVNVFHVATDLHKTLSQARDNLKPGGWLVLGECLRPQEEQPLYPEMIFQILDSFNNVTLAPGFRPNAGFLTFSQWRLALESAGFRPVIIKPQVDRINELYSHFFIGAVAGQRAP